MADNYVSLKIKATDDAKPDLTDLKAKLDELAARVAEAKVDVDDTEAVLKLTDINAKLAGVNATVSNPKVKIAGAARAEAQLTALAASMQDLEDLPAKRAAAAAAAMQAAADKEAAAAERAAEKEAAAAEKAAERESAAADRAAAAQERAAARVAQQMDKLKAKADAEAAKGGILSRFLGGAKEKGGPAWLGPLLLGAPILTAAGGAGLGAAAGLGGAAIAGAAAFAAFGAVAKPVLAGALTAEQAVQAAQVAYNAAVTGGTKQAVAYQAEQAAISKAYAGMSPQQIALSKQLGDMSSAWQHLKAAQTPVIAGALQPWLKSVTDLTGQLGPIIGAVSPYIADLGTSFDGLVNSDSFTRFRDFVAGEGSAMTGAVGHDLIDFLQSMIILLPQFEPLIAGATREITKLGPAVLSWASSKKTADDIQKFMNWFTQNGPAVGGMFRNIGGALKALAPGLGPAGTAEINAVSGFFGFIAKLPPGLAKPLTETAGVLLTLNKLGVFSVGVKIIGATAGWVKKLLGGAAVDLGAAGMQTAGDTMLAAAAAMQKAADTMVGADAEGPLAKFMKTGGAGTAAAEGGGVAAGGLLGAAGPLAAGAGIGIGASALGNDLTPKGTTKGAANQFVQAASGGNAFGGIMVSLVSAAQKAWNQLTHIFDRGRHASAVAFDGIRHDAASAFDGMRHDSASAFDSVRNNSASMFDSMRHNAAAAFDSVRNNSASMFDSMRHTVAHWGDNVISFFHGLPGRITGALGNLGSLLYNAGKNVIQGLINGISSMIGSVGSAMSGILGKVRGFLPFSPAKEGPLSGSGSPDIAGRKVAQMFAQGMRAGTSDVTAASARIAGAVNPRGGYGGYGTAANGKLEVLLTFQGTLLKAMQAEVRNAGGDPQMFQKKVAYR